MGQHYAIEAAIGGTIVIEYETLSIILYRRLRACLPTRAHSCAGAQRVSQACIHVAWRLLTTFVIHGFVVPSAARCTARCALACPPERTVVRVVNALVKLAYT